MATPTATEIDYGYRCENGGQRERNEDSCLMLTADYGGHFPMSALGLYVIADGMGGEREGHIASNAATRAFADYILSHLYLPLLRQQPEPKETRLLDLMERGVFAAHDAVVATQESLIEAFASPHNSGTTLTAGLTLGRRLVIAHVGDSRAYLAADDELRLLTEDHSLAQRLQETGRLSVEDASHFPYRNLLLQALGQSGALTADTFALDLPAEGKLLLCSDGLHGVVSEEQIAGIVCSGGSAQVIADRLYEAAMAEGGPDNITALVVDFHQQGR